MPQLWLAAGDALASVQIDGRRCSCDLHLQGRPVQCVAADPLRPRQIYCGTWGDSVFRSDDGGRNWQPAGPLKSTRSDAEVMAVAVSRTERIGDHGVVYAGTEPSELFRSEDAGHTWRACGDLNELPSAAQWSFPPRPHTHHVRWIEPDPQAEKRLFVAIEAGALIRSPDGGEHWLDRVPEGPRDTHQLATHLSAPGRLYSAAGDGYFESRDGGGSWQRMEQGLRHRYVWSVAVDTGDADNVIVSAAAGPRQSHDASRAASYLYRRTAGSLWQELRSGLPDPRGRRTAVLAAHPSETQAFYAAWENDIYRSTDGGASWEQLDVPWPPGYQVQETRGLVAIDM